jgi:hypothetical protein
LSYFENLFAKKATGSGAGTHSITNNSSNPSSVKGGLSDDEDNVGFSHVEGGYVIKKR